MAEPRRVISFVLWGDQAKHIKGAVENAQEAPLIYPGWEVWFYVFGNLPVIPKLESLGAKVIRMPVHSDWRMIFARILPISDKSLERIIFRDCDSRISERDAEAVKEWIEEKTACHIMRDSPVHMKRQVCSGMWGIKGGLIQDIGKKIDKWLDAQGPKTFSKEDAVDEMFLDNVVWPMVRRNCTTHGYGGKPFPEHKPTKHKGFVGSQVLSETDDGVAKILHCFNHGLGDAVQFTSVLKHLAYYNPHWINDVCSLSGKQSSFHGLCRDTFTPRTRTRGDEEYNQVIQHGWFECLDGFADFPSTKTVRSIIHDFHLQPLKRLLGYEINVGQMAKERAQSYFDTLPPSRGKVIIHYQGNTSSGEKNLSHGDISILCQLLLANDLTPIILDWDGRSPIPDEKKVFCPACSNPIWNNSGTGDAETLAALIDLATLFVGVDSGPQKVAMSRPTTPLIGVWTQLHPVNFVDLCDRMLHLVPREHKRYIKGPQDAPLAYFKENYRHHEYKHLSRELLGVVCKELDLTMPKWSSLTNALHAKSFHVEYYEEHKKAGLDYLGHGAWQEEYGLWIAHCFDVAGKDVLDIGCAAGSIVLGMRKATIKAHGIDLNNYTIEKGREKFSVPIYVCDALNMHLFGDDSFEMVHTNQVAEHWKEKHVQPILEEIWRVMKPGGLFFSVLDTEDLFIREERMSETEDPTNGAIKPLAWWVEQCEKQGFVNVRDDFESAMKMHPQSFLTRYDWDWFLMRKPCLNANTSGSEPETEKATSRPDSARPAEKARK